MYRAAWLLIGAAVALDAGAQSAQQSVTTRDGQPLLWRGDCVRTNEERRPAGDPCPTVESYLGQQYGPLKKAADEGKTPHQFVYWSPTGDLKDSDTVARQWPDPGAIPRYGWPKWYPVVLLFARDAPVCPQCITCPTCSMAPPEAPLVESLTLEKAIGKLRESGWTAHPVRVGSSLVEVAPLTSRELEERVILQRPRSGDPGKNGVVDLYLAPRKGPSPEQELSLIPPLIGQTESDAGLLAADFKLKKIDPVAQQVGRIEYQSPAPSTSAPKGSTIEYLVARVGSGGPQKLCSQSGTCPPIGDPELIYVPYPVPSWIKETIIITLGAGGAGAVGGYALSKVFLRRRRGDDEEEGEGEPGRKAVPILNARVRVDVSSTLQVLAFTVRRAEPGAPEEGPK